MFTAATPPNTAGDRLASSVLINTSAGNNTLKLKRVRVDRSIFKVRSVRIPTAIRRKTGKVMLRKMVRSMGVF
jgi:hypothetical protein